MNALDDRDLTIQREIKERTASRDQQKAHELKKLEEDHSKLSKDIAQNESKLKNRESDLQTQVKARQKSQGALDELKKQVEQKENVYKKEKGKWDAIAEQEAAVKKDIEKAQWSMQALTAGMSE